MLGGIIAVTCRNELLFRCSILDDLTKVASRGHFESRLTAEVSRCQRYPSEGFGLVMVDIDGFKEFTDTHGHKTGDAALRHVAATLNSCVRSSDMVARWGGEEFAVMLVETRSIAEVSVVTERMRLAVKNRPVAGCGGEDLSITVRMGVACFPGDASTPHQIVAVADEALCRAKALGRDRVCAAEAPGRTAVG
jgi:diguanylate cyclase (GGDEF)-like protein